MCDLSPHARVLSNQSASFVFHKMVHFGVHLCVEWHCAATWRQEGVNYSTLLHSNNHVLCTKHLTLRRHLLDICKWPQNGYKLGLPLLLQLPAF